MKRLSSQLFNLESRMRNEAKIDLDNKLRLEAVLKLKASERVKIN